MEVLRRRKTTTSTYDATGNLQSRTIATTHYPLRDVPGELWRRARDKAKKDGRTIRYVIIELLRLWVKGEVEL